MTLVDPAQFILWGGSGGFWRTMVFGTVAYFALVVMLRLTGKRTLRKMVADICLLTEGLRDAVVAEL